MIVAWFLEAASSIWRWMLGLAPADLAGPIEQVAPSVNDLVTPFATGVSSTGVWLPWGALTAALGFTFIVWGATFSIKVARALLSHVPFVGGNG